MKKRFYIILCLFLFGCATYQVKTYKDDFNKFTLYNMKGNLLQNTNILGGATELNLDRTKNKDGISYGITVTYSGNDWIFIENGESLIMLVDGEKMAFSGTGSERSREVAYYGGVYEISSYPIKSEQIKKIAFAKEVRIQLRGKYHIEYFFSKKNFENFQRFYNEYVIERK